MRCAPTILLLAAGCAVTGTEVPTEHVGIDAGIAYVDLGRIDNDFAPSPTLANGHGDSAMVEFASSTEAGVVLARAQYIRSEHDVVGYGTTATVQQYRLTLLGGPTLLGGDVARLQPLVGLGLGLFDIDYESHPFLADDVHLGIDFDLGCELLLANHLSIGVVASVGIMGEPGDTVGNYAMATFYGGLRF